MTWWCFGPVRRASCPARRRGGRRRRCRSRRRRASGHAVGLGERGLRREHHPRQSRHPRRSCGAVEGPRRGSGRRRSRPDPRHFRRAVATNGSSPSGSDSTSTVRLGLVEPEPFELALDGLGERLASLLAGRRRGCRRSADLGPGFEQRRVEATQVGVVAVDRGELGLDLVATGGQVVGVAAEPGGQSSVEGESSFDLFEPGGVVFPPLAEPPEGVGDFAGLVGQADEVGGGVRELGDGVGERGELAGDASPAGLAPSGRSHRAGRSLRARRSGRIRRWPAGGPRESGRRARRLGGRRRPARRVRSSARPALDRRSWASWSRAVPPGEQGGWASRANLISFEYRLDRAEGVEQASLVIGVEQGAALVLAVDVDQPLAEGFERGDGDRHPVDVRGRPSLR